MRTEKKGWKALNDNRYLVLTFYMSVLMVIGLMWPQEGSFWESYKRILFSPGILVSDFFAVGSIGTAVFNAGLLGLIAVALLFFTKTLVSGPTMAAVFTVAGFSMFGKTPLNVWPIILGVAVSVWIRKENFRSFILAALFGTALGPVVSHIAFGLKLGYVPGVMAGVLTGIILPGLASHLLHNHQGFCLYNMGFTCGIAGMVINSMLKMFGHESEVLLHWHQGSQRELAIVFALYLLSMMIIGIRGIRYQPSLMRRPGTMVSDFVYLEGIDVTFFNMGLVGLLAMAYIALVGGHFNGPTLGGVFTMVGFAAFGKHPANIWPIMLGVTAAAWLAVLSPSDPIVLMGALFGTTLAPLAGGFGAIVGFLAGFVHLGVVLHVGTFHAGMNLYNNGFAGGLVATLFIVTIRWLHLHRRSE